jgi:hypothetical protein
VRHENLERDDFALAIVSAMSLARRRSLR